MTVDDSPVVCSPLAEVLTTGRAGSARTGRVGSGGRDGREVGADEASVGSAFPTASASTSRRRALRDRSGQEAHPSPAHKWSSSWTPAPFRSTRITARASRQSSTEAPEEPDGGLDLADEDDADDAETGESCAPRRRRGRRTLPEALPRVEIATRLCTPMRR